MKDIQQIGDLHMAIHINKLLYRQGKITNEMYTNASQIFTERLLKLESQPADLLQTTA